MEWTIRYFNDIFYLYDKCDKVINKVYKILLPNLLVKYKILSY